MAELPTRAEGEDHTNGEGGTVEELVVQGLQASAKQPPLFAAAHEEVPPPVTRATSALSSEHIIGDDLGHRRRGFRAWMHEKKEAVKANYFGIMQRLHAPASVAVAVRQASPEERKELVKEIDDALEHGAEKDAATLAGLYTVVASNHDVEGFHVRTPIDSVFLSRGSRLST